MAETVNILNLPKRTERRLNAITQSKEQGFTLRFWEGKIVAGLPFVGISRAHKAIVKYAKLKGLPKVHVAEDDIQFTHKNSWQYYLDNMPEDFDLYLGMIYEGRIDENNRITAGFSALTLYTVHERFYDAFILMKEMNNLDRELGNHAWKYKYIVCKPMVAYQSDGYSDSKHKECKYGHLLEGRQMFAG